MNKVFHVFLILFAAVYVEVLVGSYGVAFPLVPAVLFYLTVSLGWRTGLFIAWLTGFPLSCLFGRSPAVIGALSALACAGMALVWSRKRESTSLTSLMVPGALIGIIHLAPATALRAASTEFNWRALWSETSTLCLGVLVAAPLLPLTVVVLDASARRLRHDMFSGEAAASGHQGGRF